MFLAATKPSLPRRSHVSSFYIGSLRLSEGLLYGKGLLHLGEPESHLLMHSSFTVAKDNFVTAKGILAATNTRPLLCSLGLRSGEASFALVSELLQLNNFLCTLFLPSLCLIFLLILQNISKWGISVIFKNTGVNLAFRLQKYMQNTL